MRFKSYNIDEIQKRHSRPLIIRESAKYRTVRGFDTETRRDGYVYLIASDSDYSGGDVKKTLSSFEMFSFVLSRGSNSLNWFFNLAFDFDAMLKPALVNMKRILSKKAFSDLQKKFRLDTKGYFYLTEEDEIVLPQAVGNFKGRTVYQKPEDGALRIKYLDKKFLKVSDGNHRAACYDVRNFLDGSLDSLAQKYLGRSKAGLSVDIDVERPERYSPAELIHRCIVDAKLTADLGKFLMDKIEQTIGFLPRRWNSKASIAKEYLKRELPHAALRPFDYTSRLHRKVIEYASKAFKGPLITLRKKGLVKNIVEIDLKSAYPTVIFVNLPDLSKGKWERVTSASPSPYRIGFYRVLMQFDGWTQYRLDSTADGRMYYPETSGLMENYITRYELDFLKQRGYECYVLDGYEWTLEGCCCSLLTDNLFPFEVVVKKLAVLKNRAEEEKDEGIKWLAKVILNSIYGVFAESKHGIGELFNIVYASLITARTRVNLLGLAFSLFDEEDIIEMHTDSIIAITNDDKVKEIDRWIASMKRRGNSSTPTPNPPAQSTPFNPLFERKGRLPREGAVFIRSGLTSDLKGNLIRYRSVLRDKERSKESRSKYVLDEEGNLVLRVPFKKVSRLKESLVKNEPERINVFTDTSKDLRINDGLMLWNPKPRSKLDLFSKTFKGKPRDENFIAIMEGWG